MLGAIFGDLVGGPYEGQNMLGEISPHKTVDFPLFVPGCRPSDDTVMTIAVADSILQGGSLTASMQKWGRKYPNCGYGKKFIEWLHMEHPEPYGSFGNGSAMRVSPVAWSLPRGASPKVVMEHAELSARVTHNHAEGIFGAQAVALAIHFARAGDSAERVRAKLQDFLPYNLTRTVAEIRPDYGFDVSCQGSVPEAIICALEASSVEEAVRLAVSLGGDSDTQACIAGSIAEARFGFPPELAVQVMARIPAEMQAVVRVFRARFMA